MLNDISKKYVLLTSDTMVNEVLFQNINENDFVISTD